MKEWATPEPGILVEARGERWRVLETTAFEDCEECRLAGAAPSNAGITRALLLPFDRPRPLERRQRWRRVGRRRWVLACRALLASGESLAGLRGAATATLDLLPYQLEPALAAADGQLRLLLADEVGLGKTVQAGFILADLAGRIDACRSLVLCPAGLCSQWQRELQERFGLDASVVDLGTLRALTGAGEPGGTAWDRAPLAIVSLDFVKRPEVLQGLARVRWDVLIVDEAHLAAVARERAGAVNWLARRSRRVVLLTATPHPGVPGAFEALCRVGRLPGEAPIVMFRRTRASLGLHVERRTRVLLLPLSDAERRLRAELHRYAARVWRSGDRQPGSGGAKLAMLVLSKRAASGNGPLLRSLDRRLRRLERADDPASAQLDLPLEYDDHDDSDGEPDAVLGAPGLTSRATEVAILGRLVSLARAALTVGDTKLDALVRLLRRARQPAIVFSEYRDALAAAAARLPRELETVMVHGGLDRGARDDAVRAFTAGHAVVLLATDAAAHGLNLQARCRLVVNLDLPWNPVRLEQRIGRVDRIGQRRAVHAVHLVCAAGDERRVLDRLRARSAAAREALGGGRGPADLDVEMEVAAEVFGRRRGPAVREPAPRRSTERGPCFHSGDRSAEAELEAARLARLRQLIARGVAVIRAVAARLDAASPWWTLLRQRDMRGLHVLALYDLAVVDGRGALLERALVPIIGEWTRGSRFVSGVDFEACEKLAREAAVLRCEVLARRLRPRLDAERSREEALAEVVDAVPVLAVQGGLFDRRGLRRLEEAREERESLRDDTRRRLAGLEERGRLRLGGRPHLALVAVVRGG
jgi:superfamily II DNA or RNA helicase